MPYFPITLLFAAPHIIVPGLSEADTVLNLRVNETVTQLERRDEKQRPIRLPALELSLTAVFACGADGEPESLTVSVLDTHERYDSEDIAKASSIDALIRVPAAQIAPITAPEFCFAGGGPNVPDLLLPGIASAQVSLRCRRKTKSSTVHFASAALPLRLTCPSDQEPDPVSSGFR